MSSLLIKKDIAKLQNHVNEIETNYNFKGLFHFTDINNFFNIFMPELNPDQTLKSREQCLREGIDFYDAAHQEVINNTHINIKDCVRFYYKEKPYTLWNNEGIKPLNNLPHLPIPVYLLFSYELIWLDNTIFSDGNASSKYTSFGNDYKFISSMDWMEIFNRNPLPLEEGREKWEQKRRRQAELLSVDPVPLKYLKNVYFRSQTDYKRVVNKWGHNPIFEVKRELFNNKHNYILDYDIKRKSSSLELSYTLNKTIESRYCNQGHKYQILDVYSNVITEVILSYPVCSNRQFSLEIPNLPNEPLSLKFWFFNVLSIEENI
ncbi:DarT ssDNA thymidine ADP-ribosyltransferase family protein [Guptibacillus hwajinpoensis]|uniref:DarT ssDNA thymidine ADP-ribosyltransferase family protein n=1 Tax=Guptibacillus hwajinpoensis TaxID=208199 RepID=UPI001CFF3380|nr:DarT ssDNA thymidine ADP-ribosyltransferase family protein [Pseudalkalibacillus hwajinpoensis]WLR60159.1 DarT ssDNA thymidine ADP-ribosyltransferase family protein [Pseudalkalibacillus hwajinpoensis]